MRLAYLGSPEAAVPPLRAVAERHEVVIAVTQPDRRRGRGRALMPTPVKAAAQELGIPVTERVDDVLDAGAELGVVMAFGRIIKPHVLEGLPMVNIHFSLLPRWRGAAPVERAILAGDEETGVCLMQVAAGLDTGDIYRCERVTIGPDETADELRSRLVELGTQILVEELDRGLGRPVPQQGETTCAAKLGPDELRLDWVRPAQDLHRVVRLGRAWTTFRGRRLRLLRAAPTGEGPPPGLVRDLVVGTGDGRGLRLMEVQPEGRGPLPADAWANGARLRPDEKLGA